MQRKLNIFSILIASTYHMRQLVNAKHLSSREKIRFDDPTLKYCDGHKNPCLQIAVNSYRNSFVVSQ